MAGESLDCALRQQVGNLRPVPWQPEPRGNVSKTAEPSLWRSQGLVSGSRPPGGVWGCAHIGAGARQKIPGRKPQSRGGGTCNDKKSGQSWADLGMCRCVHSLAATARRGMVRSRGSQGKEAKMDGKQLMIRGNHSSCRGVAVAADAAVIGTITAGFVTVAGPTSVPWCCLGPLLPFYPSPACPPI